MNRTAKIGIIIGIAYTIEDLMKTTTMARFGCGAIEDRPPFKIRMILRSAVIQG
jgi:hypothetical protein